MLDVSENLPSCLPVVSMVPTKEFTGVLTVSLLIFQKVTQPCIYTYVPIDPPHPLPVHTKAGTANPSFFWRNGRHGGEGEVERGGGVERAYLNMSAYFPENK